MKSLKFTINKPIFFYILLHVMIFIFLAITSWYCHPYPLKLVLFWGNDDHWGWGHSVGFSVIYSGIACFKIEMSRQLGSISEGIIALHVIDRDIYYDILVTTIQMGRDFFYDDDNILLSCYVSVFLLTIILYLDVFARRQDSTLILRKISKRCYYATVMLLYRSHIFHMSLYFFTVPLPSAIFPLLPAALSGYIVVFCKNDAPHHKLVAAA